MIISTLDGIWLLFLLQVLTLVAIVWAVFRAADRQGSARKDRSSRSADCLCCGARLPANVLNCPGCGLDCEGLVAEELADLKATARQLERFRRNKLVTEHTLDDLWSQVQTRRKRLIGAPNHEAPAIPIPRVPVPPAERGRGSESKELPIEQVPSFPGKASSFSWSETNSLEEVEADLNVNFDDEKFTVAPVGKTGAERETTEDEPAPWRRLQLLLENRLESEWTSTDRVRLVMWYRQAPAERLEMLPAATQIQLARLLQSAHRTDDALQTYQRFLDRFPNHPNYVEVALQAAQAATGSRNDKAREILQLLRSRRLTPAQECLKKGLEQSLRKVEAAPLELIEPRQEPASKSAPTTSQTPAGEIGRKITVQTPEPAAAPAQSRCSDVLSTFMEEGNILWGELAGGLLIVGGSIALLISLWQRVQQNPYTLFGVFAGVTLALFGAALYTSKHWKLESAGLRATGTAIFLSGIAVMILALLFAWPVPSAITSACTLNFLVLSWIGFRHRLPVAHVPALACLTMGVLVIHCLDLVSAPTLATRLLNEVWSMSAAIKLVALALTLAAVAEFLHRCIRPIHGLYYAVFAGVLGLLSVTLATAHGTEALRQASLVYVLCAGGCLASNLRWSRPQLTFVGLVLLAGATLWQLHQNWENVYSVWSAALAAEALLFAIAGSLLVRTRRNRDRQSQTVNRRVAFGRPLLRCAEGAAALAIGLALWTGWHQYWQPEHVVAGVLLTSLYLLLTMVERRQITATLAGVVLVGTVAAAAEWMAERRMPFDHQSFVALSAAVAICLMATLTLFVRRSQERPRSSEENRSNASPCYGLLSIAWKEVIVVSGLLVLWWCVSAENLLSNSLYTFALSAVTWTCWLMVWPHRSSLFAWSGSFLLLCTIAHGINCELALDVPRMAILATLLHATLQIAIGLSLRASHPLREAASEINRLFIRPLVSFGIISSFLAIPALLNDNANFSSLALHTSWLAALWLIAAWSYRSRWLLLAFQFACIGAALLGVTAWLEQQAWVIGNFEAGLWDPRSLQSYAVALASLCGVWVVSRIILQKHSVGKALLLPNWPHVDHLLLGLLLLAQLGFVDWAILREVAVELTPRGMTPLLELWPNVVGQVFGPGAWILFCALAVVLLAALWQPAPKQRQTLAIIGWLILAVTAPALIAGAFNEEKSAASTLRWSMAGAFALASIPLWLRVPIGRVAAKWGIPLNEESMIVRRSRRWLVDGLAVPALTLTAATAVIHFNAMTPGGPLADSLFAQIGTIQSLAIPLTVIAGTMVCHGVRERSAGYVFCAGQILTATVTGGFALAILPTQPDFGDWQWVQLLQLAATTLALWAVASMALKHSIPAWRNEPSKTLARILMLIQVAVPVAINVLVLAMGLAFLTPLPDDSAAAVSEVWYPAGTAWTLAAGAPLGLVSMAATVLAVHLYHDRKHSPIGVGSFLLAAIALTACSMETVVPASGYRTLLGGLAVFVMGWSLVPWQLKRIQTERAAVQSYSDAAPCWVLGVGAVLLLLGLQAALVHQDRLFAGGIIGLAGLAGAVIGVQRRSESALFVGGMGLNVAVTLAVWHLNLSSPLAQWRHSLLQANGVVLAAVSLGWLWLYGRLYRPATNVLVRAPFLLGQTILAALTIVIPISLLMVRLCVSPESPPQTLMLRLGNLPGWTHLVLTVIVLLWWGKLFLPQHLVHLVGIAALLTVGQIVATFGARETAGWLAFHQFEIGMGVIGTAMCLGGWIATSFGAVRPKLWSEEQCERFAKRLLNVFPTAMSQRWVECLGIFLAGLALRSAVHDPARPYWPAASVLLSSAFALGLFLWSKREGYLHVAGCLMALTGVVVWLAWGQAQIDRLLYSVALALAVASFLITPWERLSRIPIRAPEQLRLSLTDFLARYSLVAFTGFLIALLFLIASGVAAVVQSSPETLLAYVAALALPGALVLMLLDLLLNVAGGKLQPLTKAGDRGLFSQWACLLGLNLIALLGVIGISSDLMGLEIHLTDSLAWFVWGMLVAAAVVRTFDGISSRASFFAFPIYFAGLLGIVLALHQAELIPNRLCWLAAPALAGYSVLTTFVAWIMQKTNVPARWLGQDDEAKLPPQNWFAPAQLVFFAVVVGLSFWICVSWAQLDDRMLGPCACAMLLVASVLLAAIHSPKESAAPDSALLLRYTAFTIGGFSLLILAWALPSPTSSNLLLQRSILLLSVLGATSFLYGFGLPRLLPAASRWLHPGRSVAKILWLAGVMWAFVVLGHEIRLYHFPPVAAPLQIWAVALLAATLAALIASSIWFALSAQHDPFALSENWRTKYVYGAELLLALFFIHFRLTTPTELGRLLAGYWPLAIIVIAFAGVGLSEFFGRLKIAVLAIPLKRTGVFLPLLPLIVFWLLPIPSVGGDQRLLMQEGVEAASFDTYALWWFLASGLYLLVAIANRSSQFALFAALAGNFGLWALLYHYRHEGVGFLTHPQFWLIPLALILLAAEHLNRHRLSPASSVALRYGGLLVLYLSSTADLFIAGMADLLMSLILAVLSVLGILAGIQFRVRAFLFTGLTFLVLVIGARIYHAAVFQSQTWVWWVSVIFLGVVILTMFALFEKRRPEVQRVVENFKYWK